MSTNNNTLTARVTNLEGEVGEIKNGVKEILQHLQGKATPKATVKAAKVKTTTATATVTKTKKARKTTDRKPVKNGTVEGKRCLTRKNRTMFVADHEWARNLPSSEQGTANLAKLVLAGAPLVGAWAIGPRTAERLGGTTTVVVAATKATEPAKVYRRANGTIAPKGEWTIRASLEAQGLSRKAVDKKTAKALKVLASV